MSDSDESIPPSDTSGGPSGSSTPTTWRDLGLGDGTISGNSTIKTLERGYVEECLGILSARRNVKQRFILSGIIKYGTSKGIETICSEVIRKSKTLNFTFIVADTDHYHILHDCAYSNKSCRCFNFGVQYKHGGKSQIETLSPRDWSAIVEYFFSGGKKAVYFGSRTYKGTGFTYKYFYDPVGQSSTRGPMEEQGDVEIPTEQGHHDSEREESGTEGAWYGSSDHIRQIFGADREKKRNFKAGRRGRRSYQETCEEIENHLMKICCAPITSTMQSTLYFNSEHRWDTESSNAAKNAMYNLKLNFKFKKIYEMIQFYENTKFMAPNGQPLWQSYDHNKFEELYLSPQLSKELLKVLLQYQWLGLNVADTGEYDVEDLNEEDFAYKLKDFCEFLNGQRGKKNTEYIVGPPNCGKSFFTDVLQDFFLNIGIMTNWNKYHNFPLQMCKDVRLVFWNEPNFSNEKSEDLKKLLGGDRMTFDVKGKSHAVIVNTPIIITGNSYIFPNDEVWTSRINVQNWKAAPFLKNVKNKRLHPYGFINLIKECENVITDAFGTMKQIKIQ